MTERVRQAHAAFHTCEEVSRFHYVCSDGFTFSAIAPTEAGAFRVLNAERPGVLARFDGSTPVPARPLSLRPPCERSDCRVVRNPSGRVWVQP